jgi:DeoR family fructose operon transcriptional repressor
MFHDEKIEKIIALLQVQPYWKSVILAKKLNISKSTVQRCLLELDNRGIAERIHGGVRRKNHAMPNPVSLDERLLKDKLAKEHIAAAAVKLLPTEGYIYLDAGTTVLPLAQAMAKVSTTGITAVTNDVTITVALAQQNIAHILLGGRLHPITQSLSGPVSQNQILDFNFQVCFISADSIDANGNVSCPLDDEAMLKRAAIRNSTQKILLAASSKWNRQSNIIIAKLKNFDVWITDKAEAGMESLCKHNDVTLIVTAPLTKKKQG